MPAVPLSLCHCYLHASLLGATSLHLQDRLIGSLTHPNDTLQAKFRIAVVAPGSRQSRPVEGTAGMDSRPLPVPMGRVRVQAILDPAGRIVLYVGADPVQGRVIADDMFPIVPLPEWGAGHSAQTVDAPGCDRFIVPNDGAQRARLQARLQARLP